MSIRFALLGNTLWLVVAATAGAREETPLRQGSRVEGTLSAGEVRTLPIDGPAGTYVRGRLDGDGVRLALVDGDGRAVRVLAEHGGRRLTFQFVVPGRTPAAIEARAETEAPFALAIEAIVPPEAQAKPKELPESPRLRRLLETLAEGGDTEAFWREVRERDRGPIVEIEGVSPAPKEGEALVTFLWRGATRNVRLFGAPSNDHDEMTRLGDSDVWFGSYRVPTTARVTYKYAPDVPDLDAPAMIRRRAILATARRDPLNPKADTSRELPDVFAGESLLELPDAPKPSWLGRGDDVPAGTVERHRLDSAILGNSRDVFVYRPAGYRPGDAGNGLVVVFDGDRYKDDVEAPQTLDRLIAAKQIPPTAALLVGNATAESRGVELPCNPEFARFLADELMPWARQQGVSASPEKTVVAGASYGGLAAAYIGWKLPEVFGNVYSQSGSFWWTLDDEPGWLTRQFAATPARPVRFYLEAGTFEVGRREIGILDGTRHLRDVLKARGHADVQYAEFGGGHGYSYWRYTFGNGLIALLGR